MSLTATQKHWLWGCADATAPSRSDVKVAMPHLRGKWSPTKAILRTLECSLMTLSCWQVCKGGRGFLACAKNHPQQCPSDQDLHGIVQDACGDTPATTSHLPPVEDVRKLDRG